MIKKILYKNAYYGESSIDQLKCAHASNLSSWLTNICLCSAAILVVTLFATNTSTANSSVGNPAAIGTIPQSNLQSGLIITPNPIDSSSNLIITGNVEGGKHFRDPVPYQSTTNLEVQLDSSTLDSFLRLSGSSSDLGHYIGGYKPFYSPTGTVSIAQSGHYDIVSSMGEKINDRISDEVPGSLYSIQSSQISPEYKDTSIQQSSTDLPALSSDDTRLPFEIQQHLDKTTLNELRTHSDTLTNIRQQSISSEQYKVQMEQIQHELEQISRKASDLRQSLDIEDIAIPDSTKAQLTEPETPFETKPPQYKATDQIITDIVPPTTTQITDLSQIQKLDELPSYPPEQLDQYTKATNLTDIQQHIANQQLDELTKPTYEYSSQTTTVEVEDAADMQRPNLQMKSDLKNLSIKEYPANEEEYFLDELEKQFSKDRTSLFQYLTDWQISAETKAFLGSDKTYDACFQDKFNKYIQAAQAHMKQGKYYQAADSYSMASIYKPEDPNAYGGRSNALFAAGEYLRSAMFLSKALQCNSAYAQHKVDFVTILGNKDNLNKKIADLEQHLQSSKAVELQFLLSYIYYQTGQPIAAKNSIDSAYQRSPDSPAVSAMKKVIDQASFSSPNM